MKDEFISISEAAVLFGFPRRALANFVRYGRLDKIPCDAANRSEHHANQRYYLRTAQVRQLIQQQRPAIRPGEWLSWPAAAAYLKLSDTPIKEAAAAGELPTASWFEIPAEQRVKGRSTYVSKADLDRFNARRYCNRALIVPEHHEPLDLAYAAGFFDGEGSVTLHHDPRGGGGHVSLRATVANTDRLVLSWLQEMFGGGLHTRKTVSAAWKTAYCWYVSATEAYQFLSLIRPYLRVKQAQADLAIHFYSRVARYAHRGGKPVPPAEVEWRLEQVRLLHQLNRKGPASSE